jgi:hypothetical protein
MSLPGPSDSQTSPTEQSAHKSRPAATVVLTRLAPHSTCGLEVLLLRRSAVGAFAGMWVFPGGRVDDADAGDDDFSRAMSAAIRRSPPGVIGRHRCRRPLVSRRGFSSPRMTKVTSRSTTTRSSNIGGWPPIRPWRPNSPWHHRRSSLFTNYTRPVTRRPSVVVARILPPTSHARDGPATVAT